MHKRQSLPLLTTYTGPQTVIWPSTKAFIARGSSIPTISRRLPSFKKKTCSAALQLNHCLSSGTQHRLASLQSLRLTCPVTKVPRYHSWPTQSLVQHTISSQTAELLLMTRHCKLMSYHPVVAMGRGGLHHPAGRHQQQTCRQRMLSPHATGCAQTAGRRGTVRSHVAACTWQRPLPPSELAEGLLLHGNVTHAHTRWVGSCSAPAASEVPFDQS